MSNVSGTYVLTTTDANGNTTTYTVNNNSSNSSNNNSTSSSSSSSSSSSNITSTTFYGPNGGTAKITTDNNGNYLINITNADGSINVYTVTNNQSINNNSQSTQPSTYSSGQNYTYYNGQNVNAGSVTTPSGSSYGFASGPFGNTVAGTTSTPTSSQGIPSSMIPRGQEDLYILKSEVIPPVCPACPTSAACPRKEKCPPCPACARCPEPSFECKKVPNYNNVNNSYLPMPVLSDFSGFGM